MRTGVDPPAADSVETDFRVAALGRNWSEIVPIFRGGLLIRVTFSTSRIASGNENEGQSTKTEREIDVARDWAERSVTTFD